MGRKKNNTGGSKSISKKPDLKQESSTTAEEHLASHEIRCIRLTLTDIVYRSMIQTIDGNPPSPVLDVFENPVASGENPVRCDENWKKAAYEALGTMEKSMEKDYQYLSVAYPSCPVPQMLQTGHDIVNYLVRRYQILSHTLASQSVITEKEFRSTFVFFFVEDAKPRHLFAFVTFLASISCVGGLQKDGRCDAIDFIKWTLNLFDEPRPRKMIIENKGWYNLLCKMAHANLPMESQTLVRNDGPNAWTHKMITLKPSKTSKKHRASASASESYSFNPSDFCNISDSHSTKEKSFPLRFKSVSFSDPISSSFDMDAKEMTTKYTDTARPFVYQTGQAQVVTDKLKQKYLINTSSNASNIHPKGLVTSLPSWYGNYDGNYDDFPQPQLYSSNEIIDEQDTRLYKPPPTYEVANKRLTPEMLNKQFNDLVTSASSYSPTDINTTSAPSQIKTSSLPTHQDGDTKVGQNHPYDAPNPSIETASINTNKKDTSTPYPQVIDLSSDIFYQPNSFIDISQQHYIHPGFHNFGINGIDQQRKFESPLPDQNEDKCFLTSNIDSLFFTGLGNPTNTMTSYTNQVDMSCSPINVESLLHESKLDITGSETLVNSDCVEEPSVSIIFGQDPITDSSPVVDDMFKTDVDNNHIASKIMTSGASNESECQSVLQEHGISSSGVDVRVNQTQKYTKDHGNDAVASGNDDSKLPMFLLGAGFVALNALLFMKIIDRYNR